jgi:hypothetical protein
MDISGGPKVYKSKQVCIAMTSQTEAFIQEVKDAATAVERDKWDMRHGFALSIAHRYGTIDGDHHKMWVIDQMVRSLLGPDGYKEWLSLNPEWSAGIAP